MREGETFGHIHPTADDFDVCARFAFAGCFQCGIEFAEGFNPRGEPVSASESVRQLCVTPFRQVIVGPIWAWFQRSLYHIAIVVETENDWISAEAAHVSDFVRGQLVRAFAGNENCFSLGIGQRNSESSPRSPANRSPQHLYLDLDIIGQR